MIIVRINHLPAKRNNASSLKLMYSTKASSKLLAGKLTTHPVTKRRQAIRIKTLARS